MFVVCYYFYFCSHDYFKFRKIHPEMTKWLFYIFHHVIVTDLYCKPMDSHQCLHHDSCHAEHINIVRNQEWRGVGGGGVGNL